MTATARQLRLFPVGNTNERILVSVKAGTLATLNRYSKASKKPRSKIVSDLLESLEPILSNYAERLEALQAAGNLEEFKRGLADLASRFAVEGGSDAIRRMERDVP